ncbi:carbonic anhydrase [Crocosphaera chwakensis]|uniref:carbonic anhydrase n=1 Tax=Crocosphaera chwakensis CCY0110 TaxID=391612 RepID=A3INB7_9CHRO|nr:carbonic anhydrase family protein [Crocosphaera chwakensis]EAZ92094.1 Twin-arginine translocation pathway signal [Crocosphaera chwakensis CCY0110]
MKNTKLVRWVLVCLLFSFSTMSVVLGAGELNSTWSYEGENNPDRWGEISIEYETCSTGLFQSPIHLTSSNLIRENGNIETHYQATPLVINNNGHTIEVNYKPGSYVLINGQKYELKQFHFHTPSEHSLNGKKSEMELHLVHQNEQGKIAVIGLFIKEGQANPTLATIWENLSEKQGIQEVKNKTINGANFIVNNPTYFHYQGSLTTPPCSENVLWNMITEPIEASRQQIEQFMDLYPMNARPIQEHNDRLVELIMNQSS